jgi:hypothetical protein
MAQQRPDKVEAMMTFEERVKARERLFAEIDKPLPGPVQVKCVRHANALFNVPVDGEPERGATLRR